MYFEPLYRALLLRCLQLQKTKIFMGMQQLLRLQRCCISRFLCGVDCLWGSVLKSCCVAGLMITTLVSYLSHSQVWALQTESSLHVGGRTNRALFTFGQELDELLAGLPERPLLPALALQPSPDVSAAGEQPTALAEQTNSSSVH